MGTGGTAVWDIGCGLATPVVWSGLVWSGLVCVLYPPITGAKRASVLGGKIRPVAPVFYSIRLYARAALAWTEEKCSLRNEKLKANRAS